jgi:hypothetical protein
LEITFSLIVAVYTTDLASNKNKIFVLATYSALLFALFFELLVVVLIGCVERPDQNCFHGRFKEKLYFFLYGSNALLMLTAFFVLILRTYRYAYLTVFLIIALLIISSLLYKGFILKHTESIKNYREHDSELDHFSELSSAAALMIFTAFSSIVFSGPTPSERNNEIKVTDCFLYVTIIMSLLLMLLTSVCSIKI